MKNLMITFWHCWLSQITRKTDMFCWLQQVWLFGVASAPIQATIRLLVVTKWLSCLNTANHKFSITHSASNWTSSATDAYRTEQLYMSCCMHWGFGTCTVQQTETTMWQSTGRTSNQVTSVFAHDIINMHQFPVHTEHTKISHSLHTTVTIMYSSNGCSSKVLVLQKIFFTHFRPEFPAILVKSINFNFFM